MIDAPEWHRAGIAVSGVTLVLLIAAGIHFVAPAPSETTGSPATLARATEPREAGSPPAPLAETTAGNTNNHREAGIASRRFSRPRPDRRTLRVSVSSEPREQLAGATALPAPLGPDVEIPEAHLRFEPMRLAVSAEFAEAPLPRMAADREATAPETTAARSERRGPVTAAFVTAGSAVAGGFRSAGRAVRRVF